MPSYFDVVSAVAAAAGVLLALQVLHARLARSRPGFDVSVPLLFGVGARALTIFALTVSPELGSRIRGTDEAAFLHEANVLEDLPLSDPRWRNVLWGDLTVLPLVGFRLASGEVPTVAARFIQAGFALAGILLIAAAAYELGGPGASRLFTWIAALEPAGVFFSTLLHDEALVVLGEALLILSLVAFARRRHVQCAALLIAGAAILVATRPYLGIASAVACLGGFGFVEADRRLGTYRALGLAGTVALATLAAALVLAPRIAPGQLQTLQGNHDYDFVGYTNLDLPPVEVTSTAGLAETLVQRTVDYAARPYPWQVENLSQRLGALGTIVWYCLLATVVAALVLNSRRPQFWAAAAPILLLVSAQTTAYALTLINAGLGLRHRIHLALMVTLVLAIAYGQYHVEGRNRRLARQDRTRSPLAGT